MPKLGMEPVRRAEAINAALECFCEYGIEKTTLDMVAAKAGFSKGIIAYYFTSKQQLIVESFRAFLLAYQRKSAAELTEDMQPRRMFEAVVDVSLPPLNKKITGALNVSALNGDDTICLPDEKVNTLTIHFISRAACDPEIAQIASEVHAQDVDSIAELVLYATGRQGSVSANDKKAAYSLLAMMYGLSFFRITGFMPEGETDNRAIAMDLIDKLLK